MTDCKEHIICEYCGAEYTVHFKAEGELPKFCTFCGEYIDQSDEELEGDEEQEWEDEESE